MATTYLQSLQDGLDSIFERNPKAILLGEDVIDPYGGAFKVTAGLSTKYPGRVLSTPISEAAITGVGAGLALRGHLAIIEIMFGDFLTLCADQIINHASKFPLMFPGAPCKMIIRTPMGAGRGYGPTHSQSLEKVFLGIPGLKILAPSHYHLPGATLQRVAQKENGPVLFIENKLLYGETIQSGTSDLTIDTSVDENGYEVKIIKNYRTGEPDACLIAYGGATRQLNETLREFAKEEIRIIAMIPECIDPAPIGIFERFIRETGRVVVAEESHADFTWASGVASSLYERLWGRLLAPIKLVTSDRQIIPSSSVQEGEMLVSKKKIEDAILETIEWA